MIRNFTSRSGYLVIYLTTFMLLLAIMATGPVSLLAAESQTMPLAKESLLLDGQVIGDRIVVVGERGHILISEDNGKSWQQQPVPTRATLTSVFFLDPANGWAAGHDSVILKTNDGGRHWQQVYADPDDERAILDLWFWNSEHGYAVGAYGLFMMTHDGGRNWQHIDFQPATMLSKNDPDSNSWDNDEVWVDFHLNQISATAEGRVFISAEAGNLYRSDDGCRSWVRLPSPYEGSFYGSLPLDNERILLYGLRGHLFNSSNAGLTWQPLDTRVKATINDGIRLGDGRIVLVGLAGTLLVSSDGQEYLLHPQKDRAGISKVLETQDGALVLIGEMGVRRLNLPHTGQKGGS